MLFGGVVRLVLLDCRDGGFGRALRPHAATTSNFGWASAGDPRIKFRMLSWLAGSRSSGMRWPCEKNETGMPMRTLRLRMGPNVAVSSRRVNNSFVG